MRDDVCLQPTHYLAPYPIVAACTRYPSFLHGSRIPLNEPERSQDLLGQLGLTLTTEFYRTLPSDGRQFRNLGRQHPLGVLLTSRVIVARLVRDVAADASMDDAVAHHRIWPIRAMPDHHGEASIVSPDIHQISRRRRRLLAMPDDDRSVVQPPVRAEDPHLVDRESEQEALAGDRQLRPCLDAQLPVQERGHVELRSWREPVERRFCSIALLPEPLHELLVGSKLIWSRELATLIASSVQVGDASLGGLPALLEDPPVGLLAGHLLREPPLGDLVEQRVARFQGRELGAKPAHDLVLQVRLGDVRPSTARSVALPGASEGGDTLARLPDGGTATFAAPNEADQQVLGGATGACPFANTLHGPLLGYNGTPLQLGQDTGASAMVAMPSPAEIGSPCSSYKSFLLWETSAAMAGCDSTLRTVVAYQESPSGPLARRPAARASSAWTTPGGLMPSSLSQRAIPRREAPPRKSSFIRRTMGASVGCGFSRPFSSTTYP